MMAERLADLPMAHVALEEMLATALAPQELVGMKLAIDASQRQHRTEDHLRVIAGALLVCKRRGAQVDAVTCNTQTRERKDGEEERHIDVGKIDEHSERR